jgi:hypothetical protein
MRTTRTRGRHAGRGSAAQRQEARRTRKARQLSRRAWLARGWRRWWTPSPALGGRFVGLELAALAVLSTATLLLTHLLAVDVFVTITSWVLLLPFAVNTLRDVLFLAIAGRTAAATEESTAEHAPI